MVRPKKIETKISARSSKKTTTLTTSKKSVPKKTKTPANPSFSQTVSLTAGKVSRAVVNAPTQYKVGVLVAVMLLALLGYFGYKYLVLAWVDHTPITRIQLDRELEKRYGKDMKEQLIAQTLIENEANKRGVKVTDTDVNEQITKIEDQQGGKDRLDQLLQVQGMTREDLKKQLRYQVLINKMFGQNINVSSNEVKAYIAQNKDQFASYKDDESSESAKIREQVADQLKTQKTNEAFSSWFKPALQSSRVVRL